MIWAIILSIAGLAFVFLEFYMPGLAMGAIGGILMAASMILFGMSTESFGETLIFVACQIVLLFFLIKYTLKYIPRAKPTYSIYLDKDQAGYQASTFDANAIGKVGTVVADLKPGGYIIVEGKKHQAISQSGYVVEGAHVQVIGGEAESLIVRTIKKRAQAS